MTPRPLTDSERAELREQVAVQVEITRSRGSLAWSEADWFIDAHEGALNALLDAADELARLKAGVADRDHTTHYDDCGCRSARYEAEIALLREQLSIMRDEVTRLRACLGSGERFSDDGATTPEGSEQQGV